MTAAEAVELSPAEAEELAMRACLGADAGAPSARSLVDATLSAARFDPATLGFDRAFEALVGAPWPNLSPPRAAGLAYHHLSLSLKGVMHIPATLRIGVQIAGIIRGHDGHY